MTKFFLLISVYLFMWAVYLYVFVIFCCLQSMPAQAHSFSTSFGELQPGPKLKLQLALSDLQFALNWPTQRDLTWAMVKSQHQEIHNYLQQNLLIHDASRQPLACDWQSEPIDWQLIRLQQQYYLQLTLQTECANSRWLNYQLFSQLHEHKALIQTSEGEEVLGGIDTWLAL